jgi:hypothetical protein
VVSSLQAADGETQRQLASVPDWVHFVTAWEGGFTL